MISDALVEDVRARADILDVCAEHVSLKRVGKTYRGPCPLHGGEGPNFSVYPERGIFKCFVCGEGGDVFSFLMKLFGYDFPTAVRQVADRVGVEIPDRSEQREDPWAHLREAAAFAEEWFAAQLLEEPHGTEVLEYLGSRGIEPETAKRFHLGYAPRAWRGLSDAADKIGVDPDALLAIGLLATSERTDEPYDFLRNRLVFSIRDVQDRPIAFGGRILNDTDGPKYLNSPDSPIFHKGKTLYALNWARHPARRDGAALLVEGYMDALSLHARGIDTAVAPLGTALTEEQAALLARYAKRVFLLYDSDAAGLRATFRTADTLLAAGVHPMVATLPEGEDPDSVVQAEGAAGLRAYLEDAVDVLERKLQILDRQGYLESSSGRRRALDGLLSTVRAAADPALRDIYVSRVAERTGVRRETVVHQVAQGGVRRGARARAGLRDAAVPAHGPADDEPAEPTGAERNLALLLLRDKALVARALDAGVSPEHFRDSRLRAIYEGLAEAGDRHGAWSELFDAASLAQVESLLGDETELTHPGEIFAESVRRVVNRPRFERLEEIDRELELADERQARNLLVEKERIARELRESGEPLSFMRRWSERPGGVPAHNR
jgi:DNA primase